MTLTDEDPLCTLDVSTREIATALEKDFHEAVRIYGAHRSLIYALTREEFKTITFVSTNPPIDETATRRLSCVPFSASAEHYDRFQTALEAMVRRLKSMKLDGHLSYVLTGDPGLEFVIKITGHKPGVA